MLRRRSFLQLIACSPLVGLLPDEKAEPDDCIKQMRYAVLDARAAGKVVYKIYVNEAMNKRCIENGICELKFMGIPIHVLANNNLYNCKWIEADFSDLPQYKPKFLLDYRTHIIWIKSNYKDDERKFVKGMAENIYKKIYKSYLNEWDGKWQE